jgi:hypothetical protein
MGGLGIAIGNAFVYRLAAISQSIPKLHKIRNIIIMISMHILYATPAWAFALYSLNYDYESVLNDTKTVGAIYLKI